MNVLHQNSELTPWQEHETVCLTDKFNRILYEGTFYGNAYCGLIDSKWISIGGEH